MNILETIEKARRGEQEALGVLFERYWGASRAAAFSVTGNVALAEDAAAEGLQTALFTLSKLREPEKFAAWLRTIVKRTARRQLDRSRARVEASGPVSPFHETQRLERQEDAEALRRALASLSPALREALSLYYFEEYSLKEVSTFLDLPEGTVKRRLHDGRHKLRVAAEEIQSGSYSNPGAGLLSELNSALNDENDTALFRCFRNLLGLSPVPAEKLQSLFPSLPNHLSLLMPSFESQDPDHPLGRVLARVEAVLPDFKEWLDYRPKPLAWPGPGLHRKTSRAVVPPGGTARAVQEATSPKELGQRMADSTVVDVLDLYWHLGVPVQLRTVEDCLRTLKDELCPQCSLDLRVHYQARYRTALEAWLGHNDEPVAIGGVLCSWPSLVEHAGVAHLRLFLQGWARACGEEVESVPLLKVLSRSQSSPNIHTLNQPEE